MNIPQSVAKMSSIRSFAFLFIVFLVSVSSNPRLNRQRLVRPVGTAKDLSPNSIQKDLHPDVPDFLGSSVLTQVPLIDGHNDLPNSIYEELGNQLKNFKFDSDLTQDPIWGLRNFTHTDLPRLRAGKVSGQFWSAWVLCETLDKDAVERTMDQIDVIHRLIEAYPDDLQIARTSTEIMDAFRAGKIASLIGLEGGHSIDNRLGVLRRYYDLGVRYMTLTHECSLPWADSSIVDDSLKVKKRNLSAWGEEVIREMNRLGMIVDLSHVSHGVAMDALRISKAPVIYSHSNVFAVNCHRRNVQDEALLQLKENGGIVMVTAVREFNGGDTIEVMAHHLNYIRQKIGVDHVGLGTAFESPLEVVEGMEDVSMFPRLFDLLAEKDHTWEPWTEQELKKLASQNLIRVMKGVEEVRDDMRMEEPVETRIPYDELTVDNKAQSCRTDLSQYASI